MSTLIEKIKSIDGCEYTSGCTYSQINEAEAKLDMKFPDELKEYLLEFGAISFGSIELTGLNVEEQLGIVEATLQERKIDNRFPVKHAVLKLSGFGDMGNYIINEQGYIYEYSIGSLHFRFNNMLEFIDDLVKNELDFDAEDELVEDLYAPYTDIDDEF